MRWAGTETRREAVCVREKEREESRAKRREGGKRDEDTESPRERCVVGRVGKRDEREERRERAGEGHKREGDGKGLKGTGSVRKRGREAPLGKGKGRRGAGGREIRGIRGEERAGQHSNKKTGSNRRNGSSFHNSAE